MWHVVGHTGAGDNEVLIAEGTLAVPASLDHDALIEQCGNLFVEFGLRFGVGYGDPRAALLEKMSGSNSRFSQPHYQHALVFQFHANSLCHESAALQPQ